LVSIGKYEEAAVEYKKSLKRTFFLDYVVTSYLSLCVCIGDIDTAVSDANLLLEYNRDAIRVHEAWIERRKQQSLIDSEAMYLEKLNKILELRSGIPSDELDDCEFTSARVKAREEG